VTFQIALVDCDGLVIGSDRLGQYAPFVTGKPQFSQTIRQPKYFIGENQSIVCFAAGSATKLSSGRKLSTRTKVCWLGASDRYTFAAQGSKGLTGALALDLFSAISDILSEHRQRLTFPYDIHHALIIRAWSAGHFDDGVFENFDGDSFAIFG
jgi:hypothetical protein